MTKAEEKALKAIPHHPNDGLENQRKRFRKFYQEGYEQAEKDNELTWEDMKTIHHIAETMKEYLDDGIIVPFGRNAETFYEEVLRRFKEAKNANI